MLAAILAVLKFLPEFSALAKSLSTAISDGIDELFLRKSMADIASAFRDTNAREKARKLNETFKKG